MTFTASTALIEGRFQAEYWRDVSCAAYVPLELELPRTRPSRFHAEVTMESLDVVEASTVTSDPHGVYRSPKMIRQSASDDLFVMVARRGRIHVSQDDREALLRPGDFATYDSARPARIMSPEAFRLVVVKIPRTAFAVRCLPEPAPYTTATAVRGDRGVGALVSPFLASLPDHASKLPQHIAPQMESSAVELVSAALSLCTDAYSRAAVPRSAQRLRAQRYITDHLGDPDLTPATVAAALGMSVRYLHLLFQEEATSPARWTMAERLRRAADVLSEPDQMHRSVTEVAFLVGFKDTSHFSRAFKARYGLSPREYRRSAGGTGY